MGMFITEAIDHQAYKKALQMAMRGDDSALKALQNAEHAASMAKTNDMFNRATERSQQNVSDITNSISKTFDSSLKRIYGRK